MTVDAASGLPRAWAAANIVGQWRLIDESAARTWLETLPPTEHAAGQGHSWA
jgi:hypothetical protein